jgi:acetyltransferase-like isoleucine patch superfamily enzyme
MIRNVIKYMLSIYRRLCKKYYTHRCCEIVASFAGKPNVNFRSQFTENVYLGKNNHFNGIAIGGKGIVEIGDNFHSGSNCQIITDIHNYKGTALPYDDTYIIKSVKIGANVWLGNNVIVLGGVEIGEGAIIQAGSVVTSSVPALSIAGGHPAKVFSTRDSAHYYSLKEQGQYH